MNHAGGGVPCARIDELRIYFSTWPLTGGHAVRPPVLQPARGLHVPDVVDEYQAAPAAGDVDAVLAAFERDGYAREPSGARIYDDADPPLRS